MHCVVHITKVSGDVLFCLDRDAKHRQNKVGSGQGWQLRSVCCTRDRLQPGEGAQQGAEVLQWQCMLLSRSFCCNRG